jgi:hypothetical protein
MRQPQFRKLCNCFPWIIILIALPGCTQPGLVQSRSASGPVVGAQPVVVEGARRETRLPLTGRRERVPTALATQTFPPDSGTPLESSPAQPLPLPSNTPQTSDGDCDYWIVSSRNCDGSRAPCDADCCISYFHCPGDRSFCPQTREAFLGSVRPDRPVCFVVHGSYNWWSDVMTESRRIHRWIRSAAPQSPVQVVIFTWPSDGNMPFIFPVDIAILGRKSAAHGAYLANVITQFPASQPVSIVGHSHGARTTVAAMHVLGGGRLEQGQALPPGHPVPSHLRAVLLAAAIDHDWLNPGDRYGQALLVPEKVLLMRNSRDATLGIYPLRTGVGERALGRGGLGVDDRFALGPLGGRVVEMDVARFADWHHGFANYHERPELAAAMRPFVYFQDPPAEIGPAVGPALLSPSTATPPQADATAPPVIKESGWRKPRVREMWIDQPAAPEPCRNAVELRFEK